MSRASSALADTRAVASVEKRRAHERQDVELRVVGRARRRARRHLHAAAARRDQADADLDAADVELGGRAHHLAAQDHLGAAAQRQAERRRDDRHARVARAQEGVLEVDDHLVDELHVPLAQRHQQAEQVRARAERVGRRRCRSPAPRRRARRDRRPSIIMVTMSGSIAFILAWNSRQKTPSPRSRIDALPLRSTSPPAARIASSDSARGSAGIGREAARACRAGPASRPARAGRSACLRPAPRSARGPSPAPCSRRPPSSPPSP